MTKFETITAALDAMETAVGGTLRVNVVYDRLTETFKIEFGTTSQVWAFVKTYYRDDCKAFGLNVFC